MLKKEITPLLLGTDLGAYSMAVSFHSALGLVSHAFGRERLGATSYSKIVIPHVIPDLLDPETALRAIRDFSRERELVILVPCDDWYVRLLAGIRDRLPENLLLLMPTREVIERVSDKIEFYKLIDGFGIDYPKTAVFYSERDISVAVLDRFSYPAVVKPADSAEYWTHPFDGMKKVYFVADAPDAEQTVRRIFFSGYSGGVLLQEKIGSANEIMGVYTAVFDKSSVKVCGVFGEVMLGEPTATGAGNHVAIITAQAPEICKRLDNVLEKTGYVGIANFDLISDGERWYALELNPRQGRSCDYTRAAGINLAEAITKILIGEKYRPCAPQ